MKLYNHIDYIDITDEYVILSILFVLCLFITNIQILYIVFYIILITISYIIFNYYIEND